MRKVVVTMGAAAMALALAAPAAGAAAPAAKTVSVQVARSFQTFLTKASTEISGALAQVNAADPASPGFVDTVTQATTQLTTLDSRLGDPFSKVQSQDLLRAFKDQKACRGVVTIIGG